MDSQELVDADETTRVLHHVLRGYTAANLEIARHLNISANELAAIDHLLEDDALGPVELGHRLGIRSASATSLVDRLETAGHVVRRSHPTDRRRRTLEVTSGASEALMKVLGPLIGELTAAAKRLPPKEQKVVQAYLVDVGNVLWQHAQTGDSGER
jgi:DNA-binding MarR family transcriptional regulator